MSDESAQLWLITEVESTQTTEVVRGGDDVERGVVTPRTVEQVKTVVRQRVPLDATALKAQMNGLLHVVGDVFAQANQQEGMQLDEVELSVEINALGQVSLLGSGGSLNNTGAIALKFKRVNS